MEEKLAFFEQKILPIHPEQAPYLNQLSEKLTASEIQYTLEAPETDQDVRRSSSVRFIKDRKPSVTEQVKTAPDVKKGIQPNKP